MDTTEVGDAVVVRPGDDLDLLGYQSLEEKITALAHQGVRKIVLDLGRVSYANSFTTRVLSRLEAKLKGSGGTIVLARLGGGARVAFDAGGVLKTARVFKTVEEAIAALSAS